jgi:hypothetical protein
MFKGSCLKPRYAPKTARTDKEIVYLPSRDEICAAKRIDSELCSTSFVYGVPEKSEEEELQNFREVTAGSVIEVETAAVLSSTKDPPAWRVHQITD